MSAIGASTASGSSSRQGSSPQVTTASVVTTTSGTTSILPKGSTRRIATIRVTRPADDEPPSPTSRQRNTSCRIKASLREATGPMVIAAPSSARIISVDEKDLVKASTSSSGAQSTVGSGGVSGWKRAIAKAQTSQQYQMRDRIPSHSSELNIEPKPKPMLLESVGPSAYELSQQKGANGKEQWTKLKCKLASLRKKSTGDANPDGSASANTLPSTSLQVPRHDRSQRGSNASIGSASSLKITSGRQTRSNSQDEGIICKKDDLIALLSGLNDPSKRDSLTKRNSSAGHESGSASPTPSTSSLRKSSLKSNSSVFVDNPSESGTTSKRTALGNQQQTAGTSNRNKLSSDQEEIDASLSRSPIVPNVVVEAAGDDQVSCSTNPDTLSTSSAGGEDEDDAVAAGGDDQDEQTERAEVKWDEAVAVDAGLLGDAIEAFLKGISDPPVVEKRVSFKKC